jgi:nicotinate-nucleotide adenylyltransferase
MQQPLATHLSPAGGIVVVPFTALDISATAVRDMLRAGASPRYLLPDAVLDYIQTHRLYS